MALKAPLPSAAVTGFGCVSPLGIGRVETARALKESRDGISPVRLFSVEGCQSQTAGQVDEGLAARASSITPKARHWTRAAQMTLCALAEALQARPGFVPDAVVIGTTSGGMTLGEDFLRALLTKRKLASTTRRIRGYAPHLPMLQALRVFGIEAPVRIFSNACASGSNAVGYGLHLIRSGLARRVLVGGYDAIAELVFAGFDCLKASTPDKCRPFDEKRTGLCLGEGAAMFCLEGGESDIRLSGYGSAFDAHHLTQPHPSGRGPREAMLRAIQHAGIEAESIDYVNAHGTGTPLNDSSEGAAIMEVCPRAAVSSTKGMMGHSLGAAGAIEAAFCVIAMQEGFLPANINFTSTDMAVDIVANEVRPVAPRIVISNSFGFGGSNASIILTRTA